MRLSCPATTSPPPANRSRRWPSVVEQVVAEITALGLKEVLLWGHSSGTALAVETARRLQDRGVEVQRVFLAAQLLGDAADRRVSITELTARSNADIVTDLSADRRLHRAW